MKRVLVIEDSAMVTKVIRHVISQDAEIEAIYVNSFAQAKFAYEQMKDDLFAALVDLNLPDAPNGEVVDYMLERKVPSIVLTGSFDEEKREALLSKGIVDYVTKEGRYSYNYAVNLINRIHSNQNMKVLVVDDSATSRNFITDLLQRQLFQVLEAENGVEAIKVLLENPDIRLLITDYNMPVMDGFELVKNLRYKYEKSDLIIIGLSGEGQNSLSTKFIKNGANDFLMKPFCHEEFQCRVMHNVESLELIEKIRDAANRDYLTGAYNRRYFFDVGQTMYDSAVENNTPLASVVLDLDNFKRVNDTHGHEAGDLILKRVTQVLNDALGRFLVARAGGEEFFVLLPGLDNEQAISLINKVRQILVSSPVVYEEEEIYFTFSAGITNKLKDTLDEQINWADVLLYRAKEAGRDIIIGDDDDEEE
jgi:diguanylate cyclase (GGDEF)-like protein